MANITIYFSFFESRHNGFGIRILTKTQAENLAKDENNYECIPCKIITNDDTIYIPNIKELGLFSFEVNEIINETSSHIISIAKKNIKIGKTFYE
jgi:hypothetical protein